ADDPCGDFGTTEALEVRLDLVHELFQRSRGKRALDAGDADAAEELVAVELLPAAVTLDDHEGSGLDPLVGGEPHAAPDALPPPSDLLAGIAGVGHLRVRSATVRATHAIPPPGLPTRRSGS